jgi:hypothetical protein
MDSTSQVSVVIPDPAPITLPETPPVDTSAEADSTPNTEDQSVEKAHLREAEAQNAKNSWLYKNINPLMALLVVMLSFAFFFYVVKFMDLSVESTKKDIVIYIMGAITTFVSSIVGYYFGSSKDSVDKSKHIERLTQK